MFVQASGEELVPAVDRGLLWHVHQDVLLLQAQPTAVGAGLESLVSGQDPPLDLRLQPLILQGPDVPRQLGVDPLVGVLEAGLVVPVSQLPGAGSYPDVLSGRLALGRHLRLVHDPAVLAPPPLHHTDCILPLAVAVLLLQVDGGGGGDLGVVPCHYFPKVG